MGPATVDRYERCELDEADFDHAAHVEMAWQYLTELPEEEAGRRFQTALRRITRHFGQAERYHATITQAFWALIAERYRSHPRLTWPEFAGRFPELFDSRLLARYYTKERLYSADARHHFVMPDR